MTSIGFSLIGGRTWVGGLNYQVNLIKSILEYEHVRIQPVLFMGLDVSSDILTRFSGIHGLIMVQSEVFNQDNKLPRLLKALVWGIDQSTADIFAQHQIDVVFESADFYGWRFPFKVIAWIPDLQHRRLRHLFGFLAYWKREIGFRVQIAGGRHIMLSSEDARSDFLKFYSLALEKIHVVKFAVPVELVNQRPKDVIDEYGLPEHFFYMPNQFWRHKNHECVVQALNILRRDGKEVVIAVSGNQNDHRDKTYFPKIKAMVEAYGLEPYFRTLGVIPYQHVQALMQASAAIINPSRFEGWSTTVEEAKSLGVGMILSDLNVHKEQAGDDAIYFDANNPDQLAELLLNYKQLSLEEKFQSSASALSQSNLRVATFAKVFSDMVVKIQSGKL
ncbi:hypothetical protein A7981_06920 [Methylovorus sp. MM2]|uniref:glycosyltransferase family 4 protein n=1 Tax=Methylovorus sp. MM2 TaxID=1848038 RepID=UPI0007E06F57|nr:glycosyltransferase family 1 protein [Methylovorus sp. MM2]OAM53138.1 hypothetical protein A7981_06920 [Methylovorus sp. MM2]